MYASPEWQALLPYFGALDTRYLLEGPMPAALGSSDRHWPAAAAFAWAGDVVVVGECTRRREMDLMLRILEATAQQGQSVLYLSVGDEEHERMQALCGSRAWTDQVAFAVVPTVEDPTFQEALRAQAEGDWKLLRHVIAQEGGFLDAEGLEEVWSIAHAKTQWARLSEGMQFRTAITRTTYLPLSAAILGACVLTDHLTVSLQHSVVTCPASFVPIAAKRLLCFGATSRDLLARLDEEVARAAGRMRICEDLVSAGSLLDPIPTLEDGRRHGTVLVVDQTSGWVQRYFGGTSEHFDAPRDAVRNLCERSHTFERVVIRYHPQYDATGFWRPLLDEYPGLVTAADPGRSLEEDLATASVAVGLFSTGLPVAAAAGVPTFFLWKPEWYFTPDLAPFAPELFVGPDALAGCVDALLGDSAAYGEARRRGRALAARYFEGAKMCDFGPTLMRRVLGLAPLGPHQR